MDSMFGQPSLSYWGINVEYRGVSSIKCPKEPEAKQRWLAQYKQDKIDFDLWQKTNRYRVRGFATKEEAEHALLRFQVKPPVNVEVYQYSFL